MLRFADLVLDEERHEVFRGETPILLTATEFSLLRYFLLNPQRVLSKSQIIENVWPDSYDGELEPRRDVRQLPAPQARRRRAAADRDRAADGLHARRAAGERVTLRARLTLGLIFVATIGLVTTDVVSYTWLRTFLVDAGRRVAQHAFHSLTTALPRRAPSAGGDHDVSRSRRGSIPGHCVQVRQLDDTVSSAQLPARVPADVAPAGAALPEARLAPGRPRAGEPGAATSRSRPVEGGGHYRVRASIEQGHRELRAADRDAARRRRGTLHRLLVIELVVTARRPRRARRARALARRPRPAAARRRSGETATAIAGGDLSRRVEQVDEKTEIGRLGRLLNTMLGQIEAAFQAREASELKLRRFVADASHELRTPVTAVRAYAELFSRGAAERPEDLERSMLGVKQASERMSALVDDLFLLAHLDEGRPLAQEAVDLERGRRRRGRGRAGARARAAVRASRPARRS